MNHEPLYNIDATDDERQVTDLDTAIQMLRAGHEVTYIASPVPRS